MNLYVTVTACYIILQESFSILHIVLRCLLPNYKIKFINYIYMLMKENFTTNFYNTDCAKRILMGFKLSDS